MLEKLSVPPNVPGDIWLHQHRYDMPCSHRHEEFEINLVTNGMGGYFCCSQRCEIGPRSLILLFPGHEHHLLHGSRNLQMWIMVCRQKFLRSILPSKALFRQNNPSGYFCRVLTETDFAFLNAMAARLVMRSGKEFYNGMASFIHETAHAFAAAQPGQNFTDLHPAVENAIRILRTGGGNAGLETVGREAGLSRTHLSRLFHRQTGITLTRYRNQVRVESFYRIYGGGRINMLNAALQAGFGSYGQFFRVFREITGQTPRFFGKHGDRNDCIQ